MTGGLVAVLYGIASALAWGIGDFSGGVATRRTNAYLVIFVAEVVGAGLLMLGTLWIPEPFPSVRDLIFAGLAGISGAIGLVALYTGLSRGHMGIVSPLAAVFTGIIPIVAGIFLEGIPTWLQITGFTLALGSVWLMSSTGEEMRVAFQEIRLPLFAGIGFGLYFLFIDQSTENEILWPLIVARVASFIPLLLLILFQKKWVRLPPRQMVLVVLVGVFDTAGNAFFALAAQIERLDISAVVASLYPAVTVLLAWIILKERLTRLQWLGVLTAFIALILIT